MQRLMRPTEGADLFPGSNCLSAEQAHSNFRMSVEEEADGSFEGIPLNGPGPIIFFVVCLLCSLTFVAAGFKYWLIHCMLIGSDQALYVSMAQLFLEGRVPYVDMFDNNPPMAIYLQIPPVVLAQLAHLPLPEGFSLYVCFLNLLGTLLIYYFAWKARRIGALLPICLSGAAYAYFTMNQRLDFGQREHIYCLLYMPFLVLRYLRWRGARPAFGSSLLCGILAGLGIAMKPYFLLISCAPEMVFWWRHRTWRPFLAPEVSAAAAVVAVYIVHFFFLPRSELQGFFGFIVPIYKEGYEYYVTSMLYNMGGFWRGEFYWLIVVSALALALSRFGSLAPALCTFSFMSALVFVFAGQVWSYHMVPVRLANSMAFCVELVILAAIVARKVCAGVAEERKVQVYSAWLVRCSTVAVFLCAGYYAYDVWNFIVADENVDTYPLSNLGYKGSCPATDLEPFVESCLAASTPSDTVLFISSAMAPGYPLMVQTGRRPGSRFIHAMMLPIFAFIDARTDITELQKQRFRQDKKKVLNWYADDIKRFKPALIYIQNVPIKSILEEEKFIENSMRDYRQVDNKDEYSIFKRR